jgi:hypothetical protein
MVFDIQHLYSSIIVVIMHGSAHWSGQDGTLILKPEQEDDNVRLTSRRPPDCASFSTSYSLESERHNPDIVIELHIKS